MDTVLQTILITSFAIAAAWLFTKYITKSFKKNAESHSEEIRIRNSPDKNVRDLFHANRRVNFYRFLILILTIQLVSHSETLSSRNKIIIMAGVGIFIFVEPYIYNWYEEKISSKFYKEPLSKG